MEIGDLPPDFSIPCHQLVAVSGLNTSNSTVHKSIYDYMMANRKPDRLPLRIVSINADHVFPKPKPKRTSYDDCIGMWRCNWMSKYLYEIPAVVVLFMDLDWNHPHWTQKMTECQSKVQSLRHSLEGRSTRIALVLIQSVGPLPPGDDLVAAERATALCSACDLSPKSLFVVPLTEHLFGYIVRLEHAFHELAQAFYTGEMKRVKGKKEFLSKTTHQTSLVRCQVKLAFFSQLKQDSHTALRHYKLTYQHSTENAMPESDWLEWKTVAGLLNYKICQLCFFHNTPLDAIAQFRRHNDFFVGKAVQNGLAAIQTQHPGFYYQPAAQQAIHRKVLANKIKNAVGGQPYPSPDPLSCKDRLEYFGQRPWRVEVANGLVDSAVELMGMQATRFVLVSADCSLQILHLLNAAMTHFKRYRCPRMKRFIMVQMGEEYVSRGEYQRALQLLSHASVEYRVQRWWLLLKQTLVLALNAAYSTASIRDYVAVCLELMNPLCAGSLLSLDERSRIQTNLLKVLAGGVPEPEGNLCQATAECASSNWRKQLDERSFFMVQMQQIRSCLLVKAWFANKHLQCHRAPNLIRIRVALVLLAPFAIKFSRLSVNVAPEQVYDHHLQIEDSDKNLYLVPNQMKLFHFKFLPRQEDIDSDIQIVGLSLDVGQLNSCIYGTLRWEPPGLDLSLTPLPPEYVTAITNSSIFQRTLCPTSIRITNRKARVGCTVTHRNVMHVSEVFPVNIKITNREIVPIHKLRLVARSTLDPQFDASPKQSMLYFINNDNFVQETAYQLDTVQPGGESSITLECCIYDAGEHVLQLLVDYDIEVTEISGENRNYTCTYNKRCSINALHPLSLQCRVTNTLLSPIDRFVVQEQSILWADLKVMPAELLIESVQWQLSEHLKFVGNDDGFRRIESNVRAGELYTVQTVVEPKYSTESKPIGAVSITWKRSGSSVCVVTVLPVISLSVEYCPIVLQCCMPQQAVVRTALPIQYTLYNITHSVIHINIAIHSADAFMFSGHKQMQMRILPREFGLFELVLLPLMPGLVLLPQVKLSSPEHTQDVIDMFSSRNIQEYIFVMPYDKSFECPKRKTIEI